MQTAFHRPIELPFTAEERDHVTLLFGGLTAQHERMIAAAFQGHGYKVISLPQPDRAAHELGKEFCSNNLCNPVYFTVGSLLAYLRAVEESGISRARIVRDYVYVTAASGGPCRFGMYEAEFRAALEAAGYHGFRVLLFLQDQGIHASTGHTGLQFNVDIGLDSMDAVVLGDVLNNATHRLRPYEAVPGSTDAAIERIDCEIERYFLSDKNFELSRETPEWLARRLEPRRQARLYRIPNTIGKIRRHLYGDRLTAVLQRCHEHFDSMEVDWLRPRPLVKVIGEFWAQMTETDGNFRMFEFLEREGAEIMVEPIGTWLMYLSNQAKGRLVRQRRIELANSGWWQSGGLTRHARYLGKKSLFTIGQHIYESHHRRLSRSLGMPQFLPSQKKLAKLASPHYNRFLRGGEGHLEVAKNLYYTMGNRAHMVLALKPFGCLPSMQSDAVQAALVDRHPSMIFLSVETSADGEIHAYSRVQMALAEARAKTLDEFTFALKETRRSIDELRRFVGGRPELRHPLYPIPQREDVASTAANFIFHLHDLMTGRATTPALPAGEPQTRPLRARPVPSTREVRDV